MSDDGVKLDIIVKDNEEGLPCMVGMRQFDEEQVIERALELFWRQGFSDTSMLDLAKATGVHRGSLYNAYGGKDELFLRAVDVYAARFLDSARTTFGQSDPKVALSGFLNLAIANMTRGAPACGCFSTKTATGNACLDPCVQARLKRLLDELESIVAVALSAPQTRKHLSIPPDQAALVIVTFTRGLAVIERVYRDPKRLKKAARALVDTIFPA